MDSVLFSEVLQVTIVVEIESFCEIEIQISEIVMCNE